MYTSNPYVKRNALMTAVPTKAGIPVTGPRGRFGAELKCFGAIIQWQAQAVAQDRRDLLRVGHCPRWNIAPLSLPATALERCFTIGGIVTDCFGLGAHDLAAWPILIMVDLALYTVIAFLALRRGGERTGLRQIGSG